MIPISAPFTLGDVTESNRWLEHLFAEITQLRGRCDRLFDELGGTDQGAWMPAIDVVPTTVWSCAWTCRVCVGGDVPGERGLQRHEPAP